MLKKVAGDIAVGRTTTAAISGISRTARISRIAWIAYVAGIANALVDDRVVMKFSDVTARKLMNVRPVELPDGPTVQIMDIPAANDSDGVASCVVNVSRHLGGSLTKVQILLYRQSSYFHLDKTQGDKRRDLILGGRHLVAEIAQFS